MAADSVDDDATAAEAVVTGKFAAIRVVRCSGGTVRMRNERMVGLSSSGSGR